MSAVETIEPGSRVVLEVTSGQATSSPTTRRVEGTAKRDEEGTLRVGGVNVETDADGYYRRGVLILSIEEPRPIRIRVSRIPEVEAKIEKANRRLARAGIAERFSVALGEPEEVSYLVVRENGTSYHERYFMRTVELSAPSISYDGWRFVGTLSFEEAGTIVRAIPGAEVDYRPDTEKCDQCGTIRYRTETFIVHNAETGEYRQIGRNCLQLFLGVMPSLWTLTYDLSELDETDADEETRAGWGGCGDRSLSVRAAVAAALAVSNEGRGYVSANAAWGSPRGSTSSQVADVLSGRHRRTGSSHPAHIAEVAAYNRWLDEMRAETERRADESDETTTAVIENAANLAGDSTYAENVRILARCERTTDRNLGFVASFAILWAKAQQYEAERKAKEAANAGRRNEWIGEVGTKKVETIGHITSLREIDGDYGTTVLVQWLTLDGFLCKWFTSSWYRWSEGNESGIGIAGSRGAPGTPIEEGDRIRVVGTIKKHDLYRDLKATVFTRCKIEKLEEAK